MRAALAGLLGLVAACSDPVVTMQLQPPGGSFDASCVASVTVAAIGTTYPADTSDFKQVCVDVPMAEPTLADLQTALHGLVTVAIPPTGLSQIAVFGNGQACANFPSTGPETADLIFYAGAAYTGDTIELPMVPNVACGTTPVTVTAVDMLALSSTHKCSAALEPNTAAASVNVGTFSPSSYGSGAIFSGGVSQGNLTNGVTTIANAHTTVEAGTCLAFWAGDDDYDSLSCRTTTQPVCGGVTNEVSVLHFATSSDSLDQTLEAQYGPATFGLVYAGGSDTGAPVAGATVTLDKPTDGRVVYLDLNAAALAGTGPLTPLGGGADGGGTATGSAGLFVVYATGFHTMTVSQNGLSQTLKFAAQSGNVAAHTIRLR